MSPLARLLITVGALLIAVGLLLPWLGKLGLGRLPGDIAVHRNNVHFYFPITTSIILSIAATLLFWLFRR